MVVELAKLGVCGWLVSSLDGAFGSQHGQHWRRTRAAAETAGCRLGRRRRRQRRARRHSPHLGMRMKSTRLSNSSCGLSTSWKSDQNQSKVSEAGALEGVRFPLRTCVITIRLRDLRRCLCSLHDLSLLFSRSGRSIVASQPHTHTTTIPSHPLNERTHAMRP